MGNAKELSQGELSAFKEKYEKLLAENPSSVVFAFLGEILIKLGEVDRAADVLVQGLKHNPQNITAKFILGKIYYDRQMIDEAKKEMEEIVQSAPDNAAACKILIQIYRDEGKLDKALDVADSVAFFFPGDDEIAEIIDELKKEIAVAQENEKGLLLAQQKEHESPEYPSDEELESFSGLLKGKIYTETMADLYMNQGLYEDAFEILAKLYELDPQNLSVRMKLEEARAYLVNKIAGFTTRR